LTAVTTDIVKGRCRPFSVYSSYAMQKSIGFFSLFINYILPLSLLTFCYARIVRALRKKVKTYFVAIGLPALPLPLAPDLAPLPQTSERSENSYLHFLEPTKLRPCPYSLLALSPPFHPSFFLSSRVFLPSALLRPEPLGSPLNPALGSVRAL